MKKLISLLIIFFSLSLPSISKEFKAIALDNFSHENPPSTFRMKIIEDAFISDKLYLERETIISGVVTKTCKATTGRQHAKFVYILSFLEYNDEIKDIKDLKITAKIGEHKPVDKGEASQYVGKKIIGFFVPGLSQSISFSQGASAAPKGQKFKSGVYKIYKDSYFSLLEKGENLDIKEGETLTIYFKK